MTKRFNRCVLILSYLFFTTILCSSDIIEKNSKYLSNHEFKNLQQLNKFNGDVTESVMSSYFKNSGWSEINGEIGVNGIDGLFLKKDKFGKIKDIMVVESKYNKSQLGYIDKKTPHLKSKQMSRRALRKQVDNLIMNTREKISKSTTLQDRFKFKKELADYKVIKHRIYSNEYKARLFKIKPMGNNKFKVTIDALEHKGYKNVTKKTLKGIQKYKAHNIIIDIKKKYKSGSYEAKLQAKLRSSIKNTKVSHKIKRAYNNSKKMSKLFNSAIPAVFLKKGKKALVFMDATIFKNTSRLRNISFLKNVKKGDVVLMALENGVMIYSLMKSGMSYKKVTALLMTNTRTLAREGFSRCIVFLTPPPSTLIVFASIAGAMLFDYALDKYVELDKRSYVGLEDMFWDVPDEIKQKITVLNLENVKKETALDFSDIDNDTILDDNTGSESILDENSLKNNDTIFD